MEFWTYLKLVLVLCITLGLVYVMLYLLKKYFYSFDDKKNKLIKIRVLATHMLMPKKYIQVVQVQDKVLVLGISDHSINQLTELDEMPPEIESSQTNLAKTSENFLELLKKNLGMK